MNVNIGRSEMLKPVAISLAFTGLAVSTVGADSQNSSPATWRWQVTRILAAQSAESVTPATFDAATFNQRYERYSAVGLPEPSARTDAR
jgi:hypothetical protein